jgi:hypothetical protein
MGNSEVEGTAMIPKTPISLRATVRFLLTNYDIPLDRRDMSDDNNLRWLQRNLLINNTDDDFTSVAMAYIKRILSGEEWT